MINAETVAPPEQQIGKEQLFESFCDSLKLAVNIEKIFAATVIGVDPAKLGGQLKDQSLEQISDMADKARALFYTSGPRLDKYNEITHTALMGRAETYPDKYVALQDPELLVAVRELARTGILYELTSERVDRARATLHSGHLHSRHRHGGNPQAKAAKRAANVDNLIELNHAVRNFVERSAPALGNMSRPKMRSILKIMTVGDRERAEELEKGMALEIAAKKMFDQILEGQVAYGTVKQDKHDGDLILFPGTDMETYVDLKQTPPKEVRDDLTEEEMDAPGRYWKNFRTAFLWIGYDGRVSESYGVSKEFADAARLIALEASRGAQPQVALA